MSSTVNESGNARRITMDDVSSGDRDLVLFLAATMNGYKAPILLAELDVKYDFVFINFESGDQKTEQFAKFNPNKRIPALFDRSNGVSLAESAAILEYICDKYEAGSRLCPQSPPQARWITRQWLYWQVSALGPSMGQSMYNVRLARPQGLDVSDFVVNRFQTESSRCLKMINDQLLESGGPFIFGAAINVVDIACYCYARYTFWAMVDISSDEFSALRAWLSLLDSRPSFIEGLKIPQERREFMGEGDWEAMINKNAKGFQLKPAAHDKPTAAS